MMTSSGFRFARRTLGFIFLAIGIAGAILPIIPGWPGFIVAIILLGRRDPVLRWLHLVSRRSLRAMRRSRSPLMRRFGLWLSSQYVAMRRSLTPRIIQAERLFK